MNDPKILYAHDLEHGHFYRDLDNKIFCWIEGDGKGSPKYFNGNHPSIPKRSKVSTYLILDKGVVEVDPEEPMTTLRNELVGAQSILEGLAKEGQNKLKFPEN